MDVYDPISDTTRPAWAVEAVDEYFKKAKTLPLWDVVDHIVDRWLNIHPEQAKDFLAANKEQREGKKNKYGATKDYSLRHVAEIPGEIMIFFDRLIPERIEDYGKQKFMRDFVKRYPGFRAAEKI